MKYFFDTNIIIDVFDKKEEVIDKLTSTIADFLHFITAKYYDLILISNDKDLEKLEESYQGFLDAK